MRKKIIIGMLVLMVLLLPLPLRGIRPGLSIRTRWKRPPVSLFPDFLTCPFP